MYQVEETMDQSSSSSADRIGRHSPPVTPKRVRTDVTQCCSSGGTARASRAPHSVSRTGLLRPSRTRTPGSVPDSPRSLERAPRAPHSPLLRSARTAHGSPAAYDSDDSLRPGTERLSHDSVLNDIVSIKTMLLKLKRVLQETDEDILMRNEPLNPFENQAALKNGISNGLSSEQSDLDSVDGDADMASSSSMEMADLRRQILFLQSQLEDKERTVQQLQNQVTKFSLDAQYHSGFDREFETCNAATQTDRVRPLSTGSSLLQNLPSDGSMGPLVSTNEYSRRARPHSMLESPQIAPTNIRSPPLKLWRKPGEPPPPSRYVSSVSSLPRRANSKTRAAATSS